ncbi:hypothetical protein [Rhodococcus koreensis]|uniref:hypothetical protein n=1 Tax=Rhodococcus koreensis TaxID=99653 RepID=UPI001F124311|nr:hypothetical protein [Rhodococcus koreensis]
MTEHFLAPVPPSLRRPDKPDRLMSGFRLAVRGYAAVASRARITDPARVDRVLRLVVADRRVEADGVISLYLASADRSVLPPWHPGAHLDLTLPSGRVRQYSLCGDPADRRRYRIAVRRIPDGGGASTEIHDHLPSGHWSPRVVLATPFPSPTRTWRGLTSPGWCSSPRASASPPCCPWSGPPLQRVSTGT